MKNRIHDLLLILLIQLLLILSGCNRVRPPAAQQIVSEKVIHGVTITDLYKWMEDPHDPKTIAYINAENKYAGHYFDRVSGLKNKLLKEFEERDAYERGQGTIPILVGNFFYYTRIPSGKDFPVHYRKLNGGNAKEESLLDENQLAKGSLNFRMNEFLVSPDNSCYFYCYTIDGTDCRLMIRSFGSIAATDSIITAITSAVWSKDSKSIVCVKDHKQVLVHNINSPAAQDALICSEKRDDLFVDVTLSESRQFIFLTSYNSKSTECSYIPADLKYLKPILIDPLKEGRSYFTDHFGSDFFLVMASQNSGNRILFNASISNPSSKYWTKVVEGNDSLYLDNYTVIDQKYLLLFETKKLNARLRLIDLSYGGKDNQIVFREPEGHIEFLYYDSQESKVVFSFASLLTPVTVYSYAIDSYKLTIRRRPAIRDYQKENYITDLVWVKSADGTRLPVSMIHKNGMKRSDGSNPFYLEAYGSWDPAFLNDFNSARISLLDRGFWVAMAHIRDDAINDYLTCAEFLIKQGYTSKGFMTAAGSNEGGLVIGTAVNARPDLFKAVLLTMPVVDPLIPDSTGNLYSFSPYHNIKKQDYPAMLFRTSLRDQKVGFSGPLKMVARLRATSTGKNIFLILTDDAKTNLRDTGNKDDNEVRAENWAFILDQYGIDK